MSNNTTETKQPSENGQSKVICSTELVRYDYQKMILQRINQFKNGKTNIYFPIRRKYLTPKISNRPTTYENK